MVRFIHFLPFILLGSMAFLNACGERRGDGTSYIVGHWGHLQQVDSNWAKPTFLIHHPKDKPYKVCLDQAMKQRFPTIDQEIIAAINIWAHYLGRQIPVEITASRLDAPYDYNESVSDYTTRIWPQCPRGSNIVVGMAYQDPSIGVTSYNSFGQRGLFLKLADPDYDQEFSWQTFTQSTGENLTSEQLLQMMVARNRTHLMTQDKSFLTLGVLTHEFGHVWGLCDQYALEGNTTNCDPKFATINAQGHVILNRDAQMYSASRYTRLFLMDDDIQGIRSFLNRPNFIPAGFSSKEQALSIEVSPITLPAIEVAQISNVRRLPGKIEVELNVRTSVPVSYSFSLVSNSGMSVDFNERIAAEPLSWTPMKYTLGINGPTGDLTKVVLKLIIPNGEGEPTIHKVEAALPAQIEREVIVIR